MRRLLLTLVLTLPAILLVAGPARAVPVSQPTVTGQAVYGSTLTADPGQWSPAVATFGYQWLRDGVPIGGAVASAYTAGLDDLGKTLAVRVTAGDGSGVATSPATAPVANATMTAKRQRVLGEARFTHDLKARPGRFSAPDAVVTYTWPGGSTARSYAIRPADVGSRVVLRIRAEAPGYDPLTVKVKSATVRHRVDVRRTVRYHVETRGKITTSLKEFRRPGPADLRRPARLARRRASEFVPVASAAARSRWCCPQASRVPGFSSGCSSMWSCRVGRFVIINQDRWKHASPAWNAAHLALRDYRHMVVNHETGHWLGLGHASCPGKGRLAPVMMQQSKGLHGLPVQPVPDDRASSTAGHRHRTGHGVRLVRGYSPVRRVGPATAGHRGAQLREIVVFSGSAHRPFATAICEALGVELSSVELTRFSNDCLQAQLQANCRQRDVFIIQPLVPPTQEHLMELLLMLDAARGASAQQITAVIPYYAYARSDKKDASRLSIGGRLVADMLVAAGANRVITMTLHAPQVHAFFSVPVDHLTALGVLADHFQGQDLTDAVVVSPDFGNAKTATQFSRLLGLPGRRRLARSGSPTTRSSSTRSSATSRASARSSSTTRSPPAARSSSCSSGSPSGAARRPRSPAPTGSSSARPSTGSASTR